MALPLICVFNPISTLIDQIPAAASGPAASGTPVVTNLNGVIDSSFLGVGSLALAGEDISAGQLVGLYSQGGILTAQLASAQTSGTSPSGDAYPIQTQGFANNNAVIGGQFTINFFGTFKYIDGNGEFDSSSIGQEVYLSAVTPGGITLTPPAVLVQAVGQVVSFTAPNIVTANFVSFIQDFAHISGVNPITKGGTGATTAPAALINLIGGSPSSGQALVWNGSAWVPASVTTTFTTITSGTNTTATMTVGTGATLTFSGSGVVNASQIQGNPISASSPSTGNALVWSGSAWAPAPVSATPSAPINSIQFNDSGVFGGSADLTYSSGSRQFIFGQGTSHPLLIADAANETVLILADDGSSIINTNSGGTGHQLGFFGNSGVSKQSIAGVIADPASNVTVIKNILTAFSNFGLITNSTTSGNVSQTKTSSYVTLATDYIIYMNSGSATNLTLTSSGVVAGKTYRVKNVNIGVVTIIPASGTVDNAANFFLNNLDSADFAWDGTNWWVF